MITPLPQRPLAAGLLLLSLLISACATEPETRDYIHPGTTELHVEHLEFRGVESVSERDLRAGLATVEDPGWRRWRVINRLPLVGAEPQFFNHFSWRQDRERILAFYHQRGYFDAAVVSESLIEDPEENTVRIRVTIEEGEPTRITSIDIQGLVADLTPEADQLLRGLPLSEGEIFVQNDYRRARDAIGDRLRRAGHAYAVVSGRVFIDPSSREADIFFYTDPGPRTTIGEVHILGLDEIDEEAVRQAIRFRQGDPYNPETLRMAQEDIFDLGVFGMVTVLPAHEARETDLQGADEREEIDAVLDEYDLPDEEPDRTVDARSFEVDDDRQALGVSNVLASAQNRAESRSRLDPEVPIVVRVQEATGYNLRVGAGVAAETTRQDVRGLVNWSSRNFLGGLRRLEHFNAIGYAWAPNILFPSQITNRGVILSSELRFQQPQFFERNTNLRLRARVGRDVREGFSVWNPSARISVDRTFGRHFVVDVGYNLAYFNYFNVEESLLDPTATELGVDFQTEFILEYFEQSLAYDRRDDILAPSRGFLLDLTFQQAGRFAVGGEFDFIKPIVSAESYIPLPLWFPSLIALRSRLGSAYDIGRETGVPYQNRLYSGGTGGMRSFGRRRLSLFTATGEPVPIGGLSQFEASVEPRFRLVPNLLGMGDLWGALFVDAATVLGGQLFVDTEPNPHGSVDVDDLRTTLLYGAGAGLWWQTPVGPVRVDFAYTLSDITEDPRFRRCEDPADYNTPACQFVPLDEDRIQNQISGYGLYLSIGHSF